MAFRFSTWQVVHPASTATHAPTAHPLPRNPAFDIARLLFALSVIMTHGARFLDGGNQREPMSVVFGIKSAMGFGLGDLSVCGFFILSGYLITAARQRGNGTLGFLRNRLLRIVPGFIVASLLSQTLFAFFVVPDFEQYISHLKIKTIILEWLTLNGPSAQVYLGTMHPWANGSMWTISHEARCYLLVALVALLVGIKPKWQSIGWGLLYAATLGFIVAKWSLPRFPGYSLVIGWESYLFRFVSCFSAGALYQLHRLQIQRHQKLLVPFLFAAFVASLLHESTLPWAIPLLFPWIVLSILDSEMVTENIPRLPMDVSYGVFLYGWPIQMNLIHFLPSLSLATHIFFSCILAVLAGFLSWNLIEKPCMQWKSNSSKKITGAILHRSSP